MTDAACTPHAPDGARLFQNSAGLSARPDRRPARARGCSSAIRDDLHGLPVSIDRGSSRILACCGVDTALLHLSARPPCAKPEPEIPLLAVRSTPAACRIVRIAMTLAGIIDIDNVVSDVDLRSSRCPATVPTDPATTVNECSRIDGSARRRSVSACGRELHPTMTVNFYLLDAGHGNRMRYEYSAAATILASTG